MDFDIKEFNPVKYGALLQKVQDMDKRLDKMEGQLSHLIDLANKGQGGLWFGMSIISGVSVVIGYIVTMLKH